MKSEESPKISASGTHPCTVPGCTCQDFVPGALVSTACATCNHDTKAHGFP